MVSILGTACCNTMLELHIVKTDRSQIVVKIGIAECVCVAECSLYAPCSMEYRCVSQEGWFTVYYSLMCGYGTWKLRCSGSLCNKQCWLCNNPKDHSSHLLCSGSLKNHGYGTFFKITSAARDCAMAKCLYVLPENISRPWSTPLPDTHTRAAPRM